MLIDPVLYSRNIPNFGDWPLSGYLCRQWGVKLSRVVVNPKSVVIMTGSILSRYKDYKQVWASLPHLIFSTGTYSSSIQPFPQREVISTRGGISAECLGEPTHVGIGDVGVLVPQLIPPNARFRSGRESTWLPYNKKAIKVDHNSTRVSEIDEVPSFARRISESDRIRTMSLHVAIVSDAYGVPWLPLTWGLKWQDHFAVLGTGRRPETYHLTSRDALNESQSKNQKAAKEFISRF